MQTIAQTTTTTIVRNCYNKSMEYSVVGVVTKNNQCARAIKSGNYI